MKWYLHPQGDEYPTWQPQRMSRSIPAAISLQKTEPQAALSSDGWALLPLTDAGPQPSAGQVVDERTVTVDTEAGTATAEYSYATRPLADRKAAMIRQIEALRDAQIALTCNADINGDESVVIPVQMAREVDRDNVYGLATNALAAKGKGITAAVMDFRDADNNDHTLTPDQAISLGECAARRYSLCYKRSWVLKDAVRDAASHPALNNVQASINTGWPPQATTPPTAE